MSTGSLATVTRAAAARRRGHDAGWCASCSHDPPTCTHATKTAASKAAPKKENTMQNATKVNAALAAENARLKARLRKVETEKKHAANARVAADLRRQIAGLEAKVNRHHAATANDAARARAAELGQGDRVGTPEEKLDAATQAFLDRGMGMASAQPQTGIVRLPDGRAAFSNIGAANERRAARERASVPHFRGE